MQPKRAEGDDHSQAAVGFENVYLYDQLRAVQKARVLALAKLAEHKDQTTGDHVLRVADLAGAIAVELGARGAFPEHIDDFFLEHIGLASMLHDVGKVGTPDHILKKPGKLDPEEWAIMQRHTLDGADLLRKADRLVDGASCLTLGAEIAAAHHEWYDGGGFPLGLAGDDIPLSARIAAVADVYDALISERPYKAAWPPPEAIAYIVERRGSQFDPRVVDAFMAVIGGGEVVAKS